MADDSNKPRQMSEAEIAQLRRMTSGSKGGAPSASDIANAEPLTDEAIEASVAKQRAKLKGLQRAQTDQRKALEFAMIDPRDVVATDDEVREVKLAPSRAQYVRAKCGDFFVPDIAGFDTTESRLRYGLSVLGIVLARTPGGRLFYNESRLSSGGKFGEPPLPDWAPPESRDWKPFSKSVVAGWDGEVRYILRQPASGGETKDWSVNKEALAKAFKGLPDTNFCGRIAPLLLLFDDVFPEWRSVIDGTDDSFDFAAKYPAAAKWLRPDSANTFAEWNWMNQVLLLRLDGDALNAEDSEINDWVSRYSLRALCLTHINRWLDERDGKDPVLTASERWRSDLAVMLVGGTGVGKSSLWRNLLPTLPCGARKHVALKGDNLQSYKDYAEQVGDSAFAEFAEYAKWDDKDKAAVDEVVSSQVLDYTPKYVDGSVAYENLAIHVGTSNVEQAYGSDTTSQRRFVNLVVRENFDCQMGERDEGGPSVSAWLQKHQTDIVRAELFWVCQRVRESLAYAESTGSEENRYALNVPYKWRNTLMARHAESVVLSRPLELLDEIAERLVNEKVFEITASDLAAAHTAAVEAWNSAHPNSSLRIWTAAVLSKHGSAVMQTRGYLPDTVMVDGKRKRVWRNDDFGENAGVELPSWVVEQELSPPDEGEF